MKNRKRMIALAMTGTLAVSLLAGCGTIGSQTSDNTAAVESSTEAGSSQQAQENGSSQSTQDVQGAQDSQNSQSSSSAAVPAIQNGEASDSTTELSATSVSGGALDGEELFTDRDLRQSADLSDAENYTVSSGQTVTLSEDGVYVFSGSAENYEIIVDAADDAKVQIVLDGVSITNESSPAIFVKSADKVFVTTTDSENTLTVTGTFTEQDGINTDAVIFAKDDLVLNGTGTLKISSTDNGISGKDDVKITGGTIVIDCQSDGIEANDSVVMADGNVTITTPKDGLHAENDDDETLGYIFIGGGTVNINAGDDAIHATTILEIDAGTVALEAAEGLEATWIQINGGDISIDASDDGINAGRKSNAYTPTVEINDGNLTINMGSGDTDAVDSNGNLVINGGTININAQSPFDCDGNIEKNGGTIIVNGTQTDAITNQFGGGMGGGMHGGMPGDGSQMFGGRGGRGEHGNRGGYGSSDGSTSGANGSTNGASNDSTYGSTDGTSGATLSGGQSGSGTNL